MADKKDNVIQSHELRDAMAYIAELAKKPLEESMEVKTTTLYGLPYYYNHRNNRVEAVTPPEVKAPNLLRIDSLDGLIALVQQEGVQVEVLSRYAPIGENQSTGSTIPHLFVEVSSYQHVRVYTDDLNFERAHYVLYETTSNMEHFYPGREYGHEEMMIALRSMFQPTEDLDYLLALLGTVTSQAEVKSADNGLNQSVTVNKGIANIQQARVKSIVRLKPYRTFPEVEQPESEFLVRLSTNENGGIRIALHEADGGMWKLTARRTISNYLKEALDQEISKLQVTVLG